MTTIDEADSTIDAFAKIYEARDPRWRRFYEEVAKIVAIQTSIMNNREKIAEIQKLLLKYKTDND